eukprot:16429735-Heterocapsa_arctica.AAC.1
MQAPVGFWDFGATPASVDVEANRDALEHVSEELKDDMQSHTSGAEDEAQAGARGLDARPGGLRGSQDADVSSQWQGCFVVALNVTIPTGLWLKAGILQ